MDKMPIFNDIRTGNAIPFESKAGKEGIDREKLKKACTEFEALFVQEILKFMRQTVPKSDLAGPGGGKEVYQSLMDQELSKSLAKKGGLRIGELVYRQMSRKEEKRASSSGPMNPVPTRMPASGEK
jgi:Rod binding domain-containing protein